MTTSLKEKIIERMDAKNFSIAELERRAGLSIHSVRNILKGRIKKPSAQSLQAIAEALECSIIDLMSNAPAAPSPFPTESRVRTKKRTALDHPNLMKECANQVLDILHQKKLKISVDEYLEITKKVYFYSSREEPRNFDMRFAEWLIESQFDDHKSHSKN